MNDNYTIEEVCDMINQYIEESKGNALDKIYGKDINTYINDRKLADAAEKNGLPQKYINDKKLASDNAYRHLDSKSAGASDALLYRAGHRTGNRRTELSKDDVIYDIKELKRMHRIGKDYIPEARKSGSYANMQKIKDEISYRKRNSNDSMPDSVRNSHPDKSRMRAYKVKSTTAAEGNNIKPDRKVVVYNSYNDVVDTKLAIYESYDAGYITECEKLELLSLLED